MTLNDELKLLALCVIKANKNQFAAMLPSNRHTKLKTIKTVELNADFNE